MHGPLDLSFFFVDRVVSRAEFDSLRDFERCMRSFRRGYIFVNFGAIAFERGKEIVDLFRGVFFRREKIVHFFVEHVASALAEVDEVADQILFFLNEQSQAFSPCMVSPDTAGPACTPQHGQVI